MKDISILQTKDEIECKTQEEYDKITKLLCSNGYRLGNGMSFNFRFLIIYLNKQIEGNDYSKNPLYINKKYQASEFLEEEFPEKWCIKTDKQEFFDWYNKQEIVKRGHSYPYEAKGGFYHYPSYSSTGVAFESQDSSFPEITFEQFEKHILKQEIKEVKMKTTRKKLLSILDKDSCSEFNKFIIEELRLNYGLSDDADVYLMKNSIDNLHRANPAQKELLKSIGLVQELDLFSITTYAEVCEALKEERITALYFNNGTRNINTKRLLALAKLDQIQRLFNGNWKKDWANNGTDVYYPYFTLKNGQWKFDSYDSNDTYCYGLITFKNSETANYVGKTFINIYRDILE